LTSTAPAAARTASLSAAAVILPATITIVKDAVPDDAQDFGFTTTGGSPLPTSFSLDDDADTTLPNTRVFSGITNFGTYTITETAVPGWTLTFGSPVCLVTSANGGSQTASGSTLTINLKEGENVTCTFTNTFSTTSPSIATTLSATSVSVGASVTDSATLTGTTADAGGTVTYTVYTDSGCSQGARPAGTKTVSAGVVPDSDTLPFPSAGDFYWRAAYSGDAKNRAATSGCTDEHLVPGAPHPRHDNDRQGRRPR
jgi:hypothetical protein